MFLKKVDIENYTNLIEKKTKLQFWKKFLPSEASQIHREFLLKVDCIPWFLDH